MKVKLSQIIASKDALRSLASLKLKAVTSYKIAKLLKPFSEEIETFEKVRVDKVKEYGEQKGDTMEIPQENREKFSKEINDLLQTEIDIDEESILKIEELGDASITGRDLLLLDFLIKQ